MASKDKNGNSYGKGRTRNYVTVVYPESAPDGWQNILAEQCIPCFISPLHDIDKNPTGEDKKAHYHIMIMFDTVKTIEQARAVFELIGGVGCEVVNSLRGYARYLCHLDNPDKARYDINDVIAIGGADYMSTITLATDKYIVLGEIIDFIETENICNMGDLIMYCRNERFDWFRIICDSGVYILREFMRSKKPEW